MSETKLSNEIALALSRESDGRITSWRNNVGVAIAVSASGPKFSAVSKAMIAVAQKMGCHASIVRFGLCEGSGDRILNVKTLITPEMVGMEFGRFGSLEIKTPKGKASPEQIQFADFVRRAGGLAGVVRSVDEAIAVCNPLPLS